MRIRPDVQQYAKLALLRTGYVAGQVEVCSQCFQHCKGCESWRDDLSGVVRGVWPLDALQNLCLELFDRHPFEHLTLTGGDPQAWPHLDEFLHWWQSQTTWAKFKLQINTALTRKPDPATWKIFDDIHVSLDAVDDELYRKIRGDKSTSPYDVLQWMIGLNHTRLCTRTTVYPENIDHIPEIIDQLDRFAGRYPFRKAVFLAAIGPRVERDDRFWEKYDDLKEYALGCDLETSFDEDVHEVREYLLSEEAAEVPCYAGNLSFHAKANGDWYPCCLAGGEAITTYPQLRIGNYFQEAAINRITPATVLLRRYRPHCHYGNEAMPCSSICQYKQLQVNLAAHAASKSVLSMP